MAGETYEAKHAFAVYCASIPLAMTMINKLACAHVVRHIVPDPAGGYWLVFKGDSWWASKWQEAAKTIAPNTDVPIFT